MTPLEKAAVTMQLLEERVRMLRMKEENLRNQRMAVATEIEVTTRALMEARETLFRLAMDYSPQPAETEAVS